MKFGSSKSGKMVGHRQGESAGCKINLAEPISFPLQLDPTANSSTSREITPSSPDEEQANEVENDQEQTGMNRE